MNSETNILPALMPLLPIQGNLSWQYAFLFGGRGGAKSVNVARLMITESYILYGTFLCARQFQNSIESSVYGLLIMQIKEMGLEDGFEITKKEIISKKTGSAFKFFGLQDRFMGSIQSINNVVRCWVEEAQFVSENALSKLLPSIRGKGSRTYFTYNRESPIDPVHKLCLASIQKDTRKRLCYKNKDLPINETYWTEYRGFLEGEAYAIAIEINFDGNPWFTVELDRQRKVLKQSDEVSYNHVWLGQPNDAVDTSFFSRLKVVEWSQSNEGDTEGEIECGVDVGRKSDDTQIYVRKGLKIIAQKTLRPTPEAKVKITETASAVAEILNHNRNAKIKVDDTGVGGGVTDILQDWGFNVIPVDNGQRANNSDKYINAISEMWGEISKLTGNVSIPNDQQLIDELCTRKQAKSDSKGRTKVEPKDEWKSRFGYSPNKADALLLCFYSPRNSNFLSREDIDYLNEVL